MSQSFGEQQKAIEQYLIDVSAQINDRNKRKKAGQPTGMQENQIRNNLTQLENKLNAMKKLVDDQIRDPNAFDITIREAERQKNQYEELVVRKEKASESFKNFGSQPVKRLDFNQAQKGKDKYDVENMDHEQLTDVKAKEKEEFNKGLDELEDGLEKMIDHGKKFGDAIEDGEKIIQQVDKDIQDNSQQMQNASTKIKHIVSSSSNCCLMTIILLEIVLIVVVLVI